MATVTIFHDFSSPFSYLGSTQIEALCAELGAELWWHPMLLGAVFKAVATPDVPFFAMPAPKQRVYRRDMDRFAELYCVPFAFPSRFPMRTVEPLRLVLAAEAAHGGRAVALTHRIYRAYWAEDRDIAERAVLRELADELGLDGAALLERTADPAIKQRLFERTQQAIDAGVFGAPTFVIDGEQLVWGQDRLPIVRWMLGGGAPR